MKPAPLCMLSFFLLSPLLHGRADADEPRATLTAENSIIPAGGSVTLSCSVDGSTDWEFEWFRNRRHYPESSGNTEPDGTIRVSEGGKYICRGRRRDSSFYSDSEEVTIQKADIKATLKADKTTIPPGGSVTLTCSVDKPADLTFELLRGSSFTDQTRVSPTSDVVFSITEGGIYTCRGYEPG
ncbi:cell adhesion molecule DSCAM-like, partial [Poeciliopsis prolifica]|uniref:cell adhesion molecule DSCAM-like n=1 Tax=Poeciliopsis prolifica TaxID=188132 RepID=UPI0024143EBC